MANPLRPPPAAEGPRPAPSPAREGRPYARPGQRDAGPPGGEGAFHHLADAVPHLVWTAGPGGTLDYYNAQAERYDGLRQHADGAWEWGPVVHPDDGEATAVAWQHAVETGSDYEVEHRVRMADGSYRWHVSRARPARDGEGRVVRWYGTATDIQRLKQAEEDLQVREAWLRSFADAAPALLWVTEPDGRCVFLSRAWFEYTGQTEDEALGIGWLDAVHPEDHEHATATFLAANERREPFRLDYRLRNRDGAYRWAIDAGQPRFAEDGTFRGFVGTVIDIHARKQAEEALRYSERTAQARLDELEATYATAPVGLCVLDAELRFVRINRRLAEINGLSVEEHLGRTVHDVVPDLAADVEPLLRRILATGEPLLNVEVTGETTADPGVERTWMESWFPLWGERGAVVGINVVAEEVTERIRAQRALRRLNETLEEQVEARTREVREQEEHVRQLSRALALAEQRERQRIAYVLHDDLQQVLFGAKMAGALGHDERLQAILDEALELTRALSHELAPPLLQGEDLEDLLGWMAGQQRARYGFEVEVEIRGVVRVPDPAVRVLLYWLLRELLFNVAQHAGTTRARIVAERTDRHIRITVADEGGGFDPSAREAGGKGLGLPSVRERLELIGGSLDVTSAPGRGTRVAVTIPLPPE